MNSLILQTVARYLLPLFLVFSFFLLVRGHNEPGGGFVGGLIVAASWALYALAYGAAEARRVLRVEPRWILALGLAVALASGVAGPIAGETFLTGQWIALSVPGLGEVKAGTPLLFDFGVYLLVWGATLTMILALEEEG